MLRSTKPWTAVALFFLLATTAVAQSKEKIKQQTPTVRGSTGLFNIPNADSLREGEFSFGFHTSKFNREPGDIDITIYPVSFTLGLTDNVEFFASYELHKRVNSQGIIPNRIRPGGTLLPSALIGGGRRSYYNDTPFMDLGFGSGPGDVMAGFKFSFLSERRGNSFGLALQPSARFAINTDRENLAQGLTPGLSDYNIDLILSKDVRAATLVVTGGLQFAEDFADITRRIQRQNAVNWGIGVDAPLGTKKVHAIGELVGRVFWGDRTTEFLTNAGTLDTAVGNPASPLDIYAGLRFFPARWVALSAAYNFYVNRLNRNVAGIEPTDRHGWLGQVVFQRKINRPPTAECTASADSVVEGGTVTVNAAVDDPDDDTLNVTWKASAGQLNQQGDTSVVWDSTGLAPGSYTIVANASDGDNLASCSASVRVDKNKQAPTIRCEPSSVTVTEGGSTTLRAQASDPNGDDLTYAWTVDGQSVPNNSPEFVFGSQGRSVGAHTVRVTVTDVDGMSASCEFRVTIDRRPNSDPSCSLSLNPTEVYSGEPVTATATASDAENDPLTYSWTVDGQPQSGSGSTLQVTTGGMAGGAHTVAVTVRDDRGGSCSDSKTFGVREKIIIQIDNRVDNIAKAQLDEIALKLQQNPQLQTSITGHADSRGSESANMRLGQRRANLLRDYLVKQHNIDPSRIETRSLGESQPIADNQTAEGRKQNRRAEVELYVPTP